MAVPGRLPDSAAAAAMVRTTTCDAMPVVGGGHAGSRNSRHKRLERGGKEGPAVKTKSD